MINLLVALQAEAKPIIRHFGLSGKPPVAGFRRYGNAQINLLVTGVGSVAMASGVTLLAMESLLAEGSAPSAAAWVNVGIAGHGDLPLGTAFLASKITDQSSGLCWYPPQVLQADIPRHELITVATPAQEYPGDAAVDMEASGFYPTACRFVTGELVQCLKVVSDNRGHPATRLDEGVIGERMVELLEPLAGVIDELHSLAMTLPRPVIGEVALQPYLQRWRFSHAQRLQLSRLLHDYQLLSGALPDMGVFKQQKTGKALLIALDADLLVQRADYLLSMGSDLASAG
ncbi:MAG: hypothetical protein DRQ54_01115 [Gammaproteobacteria bacterium]|nr:MAG: hypothetical protein DRQ54_01115 [Gammaproteobacteria bacterium]RLA15696.1 MAG: hypothetical protein DRQ52_01140 [Gammaproteobacteria bacterium]